MLKVKKDKAEINTKAKNKMVNYKMRTQGHNIRRRYVKVKYDKLYLQIKWK